MKYLKENHAFNIENFIAEVGITNEEIISLLNIYIKRNSDATFREVANKTLRIASRAGDFELVKKLVANNLADVNADSGMPLRYAAESGNYDITKYLLENGANVDIKYAIMWTEVNAEDMGRELADKIKDLLNQYISK